MRPNSENIKHPRPLTAEKLGSQLNNHRTAEGNRDRTLIKLVHDLETAFQEKMPSEFVALTPFGSRTKGYAERIPMHKSDYDILIGYVASKSEDVFRRAQILREFKNIARDYFTTQKLGVDNSVLAANLNPEVFLKSLKLKYYPNLVLACRVLYGKSAGDTQNIQRHRILIGEAVKSAIPTNKERQNAVLQISDCIVDWELYPKSNAKLTERTGLGKEEISQAKLARRNLWIKRLSKYMTDPVPPVKE